MSFLWTGVPAVAIQIYLACFRGGFWRLRERLVSAVPVKSGASITVVIPARDEAELTRLEMQHRCAENVRATAA